MTKTAYWKRLEEAEFALMDWKDIDPVVISEYPWDENGYKPEVEVRFFYTSRALHINFRAFEDEIKAEPREANGAVHLDSCVEIFFNPAPDKDKRYFNFEINALGVLHLAVGEGRHDRVLIDPEIMDDFKIKSSITEDNIADYNGEYWEINLEIPFSFIEDIYGEQDFSKGKKIRGNFQKCGDETKFEHYGSWNRIGSEQPDFHRPDFFGDFILD